VVLDLSWDVIKDVAAWAGAAQKAARTKAERRIANVVEHAGVLVAGVNRLNAQVVELIKPLAYFDPNEWTAEDRKQLARALILFSEESVVVPRMLVARDALRALLPDVADHDVAGPASRILDVTDWLFDSIDSDARRTEPYLHHEWSLDPELLPVSETALVLESAVMFVRYAPDTDLDAELPNLLHLVRTAHDPDEVAMLQRLARLLTQLEDPASERDRAFGVNRGDTPIRSVLAPYAGRLQAIFGQLIAAQQRAFPNLPPPTWAF
jgi:hypothetical protein